MIPRCVIASPADRPAGLGPALDHRYVDQGSEDVEDLELVHAVTGDDRFGRSE